MSVMLSKTYKAFIKAGVDEEDAIEAATELAAYKEDIGDLKVIKWGIAVIIAVVVLPYLKALTTL